MINKKILLLITLLLAFGGTLTAQEKGNENTVDSASRGESRVNPSTLGMEFELPLGNFPGRGINVPVTLNYSSKLWRLDYTQQSPDPGPGTGQCRKHYTAIFGDKTASGWTTSMATPFIEYVGAKTFYDAEGEPMTNAIGECGEATQTAQFNFYYVRRIVIHLPGGETHELRADDTPVEFATNINDDPRRPANAANWDAVYYAADGSNMRFMQNSASGQYRLQLPDGSFYDFDPSATNLDDRKASRFTDRHGNFIEYRRPDAANPNGYWVDSLGRLLAVPFGPQAPSAPTTTANPQLYVLPGMTGTFKLQWKQLKGASAGESGLTDYSQSLRYYGDSYACGTPSQYCRYPAGTFLFAGGDTRIMARNYFNPIVLTEIEMPGGQKYKFSYDVYGRIEKVKYPAGGEESLTYAVIPTLNSLDPTDSAGNQSNFGVVSRKLSRFTGDTAPYTWTYAADHTASGYRVTTNSPDGTKLERLLVRGADGSTEIGRFGADESLAGMPIEESTYSTTNRLLRKTVTSWTRTAETSPFQWHPRKTSREIQVFDATGAALSSVTTFEYFGDLTRPETPLLVARQNEFDYTSVGATLPSVPARVTETTFAIGDPALPEAVRAQLESRNLGGVVTATTLRDGNGNIATQTENRYDEPGYSPSTGLGNVTTIRTWDSSKGGPTTNAAYISVRKRYDVYGNEIESIDAKGVSTFTEFDPTFHAFPVKVTNAVADPTGINGSNVAASTTVSYDMVRGLPLVATDANGVETRYSYDPLTLRPIRTEFVRNGVPVGGATETIYTDTPNNFSIRTRKQIDTDRWTETTTFLDGLGRAFKTVKPTRRGNVVVEKEFDAEGREKRVSNAYFEGSPKAWTEFVYNENGLLAETRLPDGSRSRKLYGVLISDLTGTTTTVIDQAGKKRTGVTDAFGRMIRVVEDPDGQNLTTNYTFDVAGNLRRSVQGEQTRIFSYDSLGRLLFSRIPEQDVNTALVFTDAFTGNSQWSAQIEYDDNGNIRRTTDARGLRTTNTYDSLNRVKLTDYSDSTPDVAFYYDGRYVAPDNTNRVAPGAVFGTKTGNMGTGNRNFATAFDAVGRPIASQQVVDGQVYNFAYRYNLTTLVAETYPSGRTVEYDFDIDGELARVGGQTSATAKTYANGFLYNADGDPTTMRLGNGRWETNTFNSRGQLTDLRLGSSASDPSVLKLEFGYGANTENNGGLRSQRISFNGLTTPFEQRYEYDSLNRISAAEEFVGTSQIWRQAYAFDRYGNRRIQNGSSFLASGATKVVNPIAGQSNNRLLGDQDSDGVTDYQFDKNGSVIVDAENRRFDYDGDSRMKSFFAPTNTSSTPDGVYVYDGHGRRIKKTTALESTVFVYDINGKLAAEYSTAAPSRPATNFLTNDHLGSARVITDGSGAVIARRDFGAYGEELYTAQRTSATGYRPADIRQNYTGYQKDTESGLDFAQARYYSSLQGRFTSVDPLGSSASLVNPQTLNRYTYALNSPYKFTDPLGLEPAAADRNPGGRSGAKKKKKTPKKKPQAQTPPPLQPNPNYVVPQNVRQEAANPTSEGTWTSADGTSAERVTIQMPPAMVTFRQELATFAYTQQAAATTQSIAARAVGPVVPQTVSIDHTLGTTDQTTTTTSVGGSATVSQNPSGTLDLGTSTTTQTGTNTNQGVRVEGASTSTAVQVANIATQTNVSITNFLNQNVDASGGIQVTTVNDAGQKKKAVWTRESIRRNLMDFVKRVRQQADVDFGGL